MAFDKSSCAICCSIFSMFAFVFLLIIGTLIETQPLFVTKITNVSAAAACFESALLYASVTIVSAGFFYYEQRKKLPLERYKNLKDYKNGEKIPLLITTTCEIEQDEDELKYI